MNITRLKNREIIVDQWTFWWISKKRFFATDEKSSGETHLLRMQGVCGSNVFYISPLHWYHCVNYRQSCINGITEDPSTPYEIVHWKDFIVIPKRENFIPRRGQVLTPILFNFQTA